MEWLTMSNESLRVEVLPEFGAKISSLRILPENEELLQQPLQAYAPRTRTMAFDEGDASGIDECIPTVSGCSITTLAGKLVMPDHGDFWRIPFSHRRDGEALVLAAEGFSLPLRFEKRLTLDGNRLQMEYRLTNHGSEGLPYLWSAHPGFAVEAGDRIVLPESVKKISVWYSRGSRLGEPGTTHPWPLTRGAGGEAIDLRIAGTADAGVGDKIFATAPGEGWVALERRQIGRRIEVRFDPKESPYVGLWMAYGGWPEGRAKRQYCIALEPCTAPVDSLAAAIERGSARTLAAGAHSEWKIEIRVVPA